MFIRERDFDLQVVAATRQVSVPDTVRDNFPALVKAVIGAESSFDPRAYRAEPQLGDASRGLMQVLERTARGLGYTATVGDDVTRTGGLYDPQVSIFLGTKLLAANIAQARGDVAVAISAYNAGWSPSRTWDAKRTAAGAFVNQEYVDRVLRFWAYYRAQPLRLAAVSLVDDKPAAPPKPDTTFSLALVALVVVAALVLYLTLGR